MKPVSVAMIVKNEERCLDRCLSSLDPAWEKIIVDTGSTDKSVEIAKSHKARVYRFDWIDDFSAARNLSLEKARRDWIFMIDADEWLDPGLTDKINFFVKQKQFAAFEVMQVSKLEGGGELLHPTFRIFHNHPSIRYIFPAHEQVAYSIDAYCRSRGYSNARTPEIRLNHDGYAPCRAQSKIDRALPLMEKTIQQYPDYSYPYAKYAQILYQLKRHEEEFVALKNCIDRIEPGKRLPDVEKGAIERFKVLCAAKNIVPLKDLDELLASGIEGVDRRMADLASSVMSSDGGNLRRKIGNAAVG